VLGKQKIEGALDVVIDVVGLIVCVEVGVIVGWDDGMNVSSIIGAEVVNVIVGWDDGMDVGFDVVGWDDGEEVGFYVVG
jgi:hypothetical protein